MDEKIDMIIRCQDCGKEFVFSAKEQNFYEEHNYLPPKRCRFCRNARTLRRNRINY